MSERTGGMVGPREKQSYIFFACGLHSSLNTSELLRNHINEGQLYVSCLYAFVM